MKEKKKAEEMAGLGAVCSYYGSSFLSRSFGLVYYATPCRGCLYLCQ